MVPTALSLDDSDEIYARLSRRNRIVGILRIGVPIIGLIVLAGLVVQIIAANLALGLSVGSVRIDRGALIVDSPEYSGRTADGTVYVVRASVAETVLAGADEIALADTDIDLTRPDGYRMFIKTGTGIFEIGGQVFSAKGRMDVVDSRSARAELDDSVINLATQQLDVSGHARLYFADGSVLDAAEMVYNAEYGVWAFERVRLVIPQAEEE